MSSTGKNRAVVNGGDAATNLLPPPPPNVPPDLTRATAKYKRHAWIAGFGLLAFVALYLFLTGWFCWTAYRLITFALGPAREGVWPFVAGVLSALLGAFLLSAMFFIKTGGDAKSNEITAQDEPELFTFLNALADRVGAPRPHRVFLSSRVNAGVFYDLSFANLLLPTKKNLEIGLGLVNSLTLSEFTAVLAHEFGHFAQRSMAVGRWVYTAQQVAGQIVVARSWLDKLLAGLSTIDIRVAWIGWIMRLVVWSIRSLLDTAFRLVVLAERALGREMEFQADLVIVAIGENAPAPQTEAERTRFLEAVSGLLTELQRHGRPTILVRSQFWPDDVKDPLLKQAADAAEVRFVDIRAIGRDPSHTARAERQIEHAGVAGHPGDKGMAAIADALWKALQ